MVVACLFDYVFRGQQISDCKLNVSAAASGVCLSLHSKISRVIIVKSRENFGLVPDSQFYYILHVTPNFNRLSNITDSLIRMSPIS